MMGYEVVLMFFYLPSSDMAKQRVRQRVSKGGHNILPYVIERRYELGVKNLFEFIKIVNHWFLYQNADTPPLLIAEGELREEPIIHIFEIWEYINKT